MIVHIKFWLLSLIVGLIHLNLLTASGVSQGQRSNNETTEGVSPDSSIRNDSSVPQRADATPAEDVNYSNPFSYEPKGLVIVVIIVGAFLLMAIVVGTVILMRSVLCPRYAAWFESHPRLKKYMPQWHLSKAQVGRGRRRRHSATESHLELPKTETDDKFQQDSLDNMATEIDNESFLASLENVNFSVTPPSVRRNFTPSYLQSHHQPHPYHSRPHVGVVPQVAHSDPVSRRQAGNDSLYL